MTKKTSNRFSPEVRQRAVRMVLDHGGDHASQWSAIGSIASKIGCTAETLRKWVRQAERDQGLRAGLTTDERARLKALERANCAKPTRSGARHPRILMAWMPPPGGIRMCQRGDPQRSHSRGGMHDRGYDHRHRSRKAGVPGARRCGRRLGGVPEKTVARAVPAVPRGAAALHRGDG